MSNRLIEIFSENKKASNELSMMLLQYFSFKAEKGINKNDLKLFLDKNELEELSEKEKEECLLKLIELKKELAKQRKAYSEWIYDNTQANILKAKESQYDLDEESRAKVSLALANVVDKIDKFDFLVFDLMGIKDKESFLKLLDKAEPIFVQSYRKEKNFFDMDFLLKLNNFSADDLLKKDNLNLQVLDFLKSTIFNMEDEIIGELFESLLEKLQKGFSNPISKKPTRFFSLLSKITSFELRAFNTFVKGVNFG